MSASRRSKPRVARAGDICVLLEPAPGKVAQVRQLQRSLQSVFGGHPHRRVHLTCQRFAVAEEGILSDIVQHLRSNLTAIRPFPVTARSLVQAEHRFWESRLLRWPIELTDELLDFARVVADVLVAAHVTPHFPLASGWQPTHVTALEAIPKVDLGHLPASMVYPHPLFTGEQVVLSKILGRRQFDILETIQLAEVQPT